MAAANESKKTDVRPKQHIFKRLGNKINARLEEIRSKRAHRSFRRTKKRDYNRSLKLPGYFSFTFEVFGTLWKFRKLFGSLVLVLTLLVLILSGLSSQSTYDTVRQTITSEDSQFSWLEQVGLLSAAALNSVTSGLGEAQQIYIGFVVIMTWLVTVWLLREIIADKTIPRLRDGLYNAAAPLVSTIMLSLVLLLQFLPVGLLAIAYAALASANLVQSGLGSFMFFGIGVLVLALTLYWIASTLFALIIITLPGMYPARALRAASDLVYGRRSTIFFRIIWMLVAIGLLMAVIIIPVVIIEQSLSSLEWASWLPLVPIGATLVSVVTTIWASAYIYLLYRKVVAHDA